MTNPRRGGQPIAPSERVEETSPCWLNRIASFHPRAQCGQGELDHKRDPRHVAHLDDRASERVLHVMQTGDEGSIESPDQRRLHFSCPGLRFTHRRLPSKAATHCTYPVRKPPRRPPTRIAISAAGFGPSSPRRR